MPTRREFLKSLSGATAGVSFVGCSFVSCALGSTPRRQQPAPQPGANRKRREVALNGQRVLTIDVHCHFRVPEVWDLIKDRVRREGLTGDLQQALPLETRSEANEDSVEHRLADMDEMGIDVQALCINPFWYWADPELARKIIQLQNEKIAAVCTAYPDRFLGLGSVALQHPALAVEQMEEGVNRLGMRGFTISGSVNGQELSDPKFHTFWAKAEQLQTLIFIHPQGFSGTGDNPTPTDEPRLQGNGLLGNVIGQPLETSVAIAHLIQEGTLDLFPGLKICAAHGGGYLPTYSGRSDQCLIAKTRDCKPVRKLPSEYLKQLYYDSVLFTPEDMRHLIAVVGASQVVVGTDYPTLWNRNPVDRILAVPGLTDEERVAILGGTLAKLLKLHV
jgi:aminocarboxymuconate-semialdehyde decarboxylase